MRRLVVISISVIIALIAASCGDKQFDSLYDGQEKTIETLVNNLTKGKDDATVESINGSVRVTVVHGEGTPLSENGAVAFYYAGYYITSGSLDKSTMFATNNESFASSQRWSVTDTTAFAITTIKLGEDEIVEGLKNGLVGVKGGDECYVLFSGKRGFGKKKIANIPAHAALAYRLWIKSVSND
ncbi:MAG: FKBP-type peptidyl-prolyl cis-trans isomerase [Bacteroidales bacterium]|nr:FKBP-type peptidyl-prolyl cis-trans isomerase [Bacteroidales bacterium]